MAGPFYQNQNGAPNQGNYQPQGWQNSYAVPYSTMQQQQQSQMQTPRLPYDNQTPSQSVQQYLPGKVVLSHEDIKPNEVPMDGSISLFPLNDYSAIIAKQWDSNGLIQTVKYVPEQPPKSVEPQQNDISSAILERLDVIEKKLDRKPYYKKPYNKSRNYGQDETHEKGES